jgi:hypothetical protein
MKLMQRRMIQLSPRLQVMLQNKRAQRAWATFWFVVFTVCFATIMGAMLYIFGRYVPCLMCL